MDANGILNILLTWWPLLEKHAVLIEKDGLAFDADLASVLIFDKQPDILRKYPNLFREFVCFFIDFAGAEERKDDYGVVYLRDAKCSDLVSAKEAFLSMPRQILQSEGEA